MARHTNWREIRRRTAARIGEERFEAGVAAARAAMEDAAQLADLRTERGFSQRELAAAMEISQARVARLESEHQRDIYLSTLRSYVEALGGHLEVTAVFDDARVPVAFGPEGGRR